MPSAARAAPPSASGDVYDVWPSHDESEHDELALEEKLISAVEGLEKSLSQHHEFMLSQITSLIAATKERNHRKMEEDATAKISQHPEHRVEPRHAPSSETLESSLHVEPELKKTYKRIAERTLQAAHADRDSIRSSTASFLPSLINRRAIIQTGHSSTTLSSHRASGFLTDSVSSFVSVLNRGPQSQHDKMIDYIANKIAVPSGTSSSSVLAQMRVCSNATFVGCEVNYLATNPNEASVPAYFRAISFCYTGVFVAELVLRLISDWSGFLCESDMAQFLWNYLDIFIVVSSLVEIGIDFAANSSIGAGGGVSVSNIQTIRVIRVFRLLRLIRIARFVRFIRSLRLMIYSIFHTLMHVFWAMILLGVIMYIFAILFTSAATSYKTTRLINDDAPFIPDLEECWGSIDVSMLSLFMSIAAGISWVHVIEPLSRLNTIWTYLFLLYVSFTYFAVLNVVTGVFCQAALQSSNEDQDAMLQTFVRHKRIYTERFMDLFKNIDTEDRGIITIYEFVEHMYNDDVRNYFASLGLESTDALCIFDLLEEAGSGGVKVEEFVMGCLRLKGFARSSDMLKLLHEHRLLSEQIKEHFNIKPTRLTRAKTFLQNDLLV